MRLGCSGKKPGLPNKVKTTPRWHWDLKLGEGVLSIGNWFKRDKKRDTEIITLLGVPLCVGPMNEDLTGRANGIKIMFFLCFY